MPYVKGEDRYRAVLFPESIEDYVDKDNPVRVIDAYVEQLDMVEKGFKFAEPPTSKGRPPYDPKLLLKLYLYGHMNRVRSSRRLEQEAKRNLEVMWLLGKLTPDFKTIADFRKDHSTILREVFKDFNGLCISWGLYGKKMVAIDSSKFKASNSKKKNYSKKKIERNMKQIEEKIDKYLEQLDKNDEAESDERVPTAEEIKQRVDQLRNRKKMYEGMTKKLEESGQSEISTTDPDSRLMNKGDKSVEVGYNVQTTVDAEHKLVLDFEVTSQANDVGQLSVMSARAKELLSGEDSKQNPKKEPQQEPEEESQQESKEESEEGLKVLADKGYFSAEDLKKCSENGIIPYVCKQSYSNGTGDKDFYPDKFKYDKESNTYICPAGQVLKYSRTRREKGKEVGADYKNYKACGECEFKQRCTRSKHGRSIFRHIDQDFVDTIIERTEANIETYRLRQTIVEHPFGTIKRSWDAYYFLTRRKESVTGEMALSYLTYNMKRVINILGVEELVKRLKERKELALQ